MQATNPRDTLGLSQRGTGQKMGFRNTKIQTRSFHSLLVVGVVLMMCCVAHALMSRCSVFFSLCRSLTPAEAKARCAFEGVEGAAH